MTMALSRLGWRHQVSLNFPPLLFHSRCHVSLRLAVPFRPTVTRPPTLFSPLFIKTAALAGVGFGLSLAIPKTYCDAVALPDETRAPRGTPPELPPLPVSSVSLYQLSFGTVSGICAGIFIKKGAKVVAWFLGGVFVLLQYLGSASLVRVDWGKIATRFENAFYSKDMRRPPSVIGLWNWTIDFLTADFQPRASFIAGLVLGLRIG